MGDLEGPTIDVVIAAYNPGPFLQIALDGLMAQSFKNWRAVVVDDGSDENLEWVAGLDHRIRLVRQPNAGVSAARNRGVDETRSDLIAFLDQDDLWLPEYLEAQVASIESADVVLSSTAFEIIDAHGARIGPGFKGGNADYGDLLCGCGLQLSTVVVRRSAFAAVHGFRPYIVSQDWDLWLRLAELPGARLARVDRVLGYWRKHTTNGSRDYSLLWREGRRILRMHDHPNASVGRARVRELSGRQAFDVARSRDASTIDRAKGLLWAAAYAPKYTFQSLVAWVLQRVGIGRKDP